MLNLEDLRTIAEIILAIITATIAVITAIWANYKFREYREFKYWIQFAIDANIYKLNTSTKEMKPFILEKDGTERKTQPEKHTHAVEVVLKFTNKGKKRLRIYNIRTKISTLPTENVRLAENKDEDGHLRLITIFNSGNIVPEDIKFYYIEPQVEQVITFLTLITEPRELLRVNGKFSLEQDRIFPKKEVLLKYPSPLKQIYKLFPCLEKYVSSKKNSFLCKQIFKRFPRLKKYVTRKPRLLPHTAERTYQLDSEGYVKI